MIRNKHIRYVEKKHVRNIMIRNSKHRVKSITQDIKNTLTDFLHIGPLKKSIQELNHKMPEIRRTDTVYEIQSLSYLHKKLVQTNKLQSKNPLIQIMEMSGNDRSSLK